MKTKQAIGWVMLVMLVAIMATPMAVAHVKAYGWPGLLVIPVLTGVFVLAFIAFNLLAGDD